VFGNDGEEFVKELMIWFDYSIVPTFDYKSAKEQSPRLYHKGGYSVIPDLDCGHESGRMWIECKRYNTSPWNRELKANTHGIKRRLYENYLDVQKRTNTPVYLFIIEHSIQLEDKSIIREDRVLYASLDILVPHECQCQYCKSGTSWECKAPIKKSVYFLRSQFAFMPLPPEFMAKHHHLLNKTAAT